MLQTPMDIVVNLVKDVYSSNKEILKTLYLIAQNNHMRDQKNWTHGGRSGVYFLGVALFLVVVPYPSLLVGERLFLERSLIFCDHLFSCEWASS